MIGFIGLGIMGMPMVRNLLAAGEEIMVFDINQSLVQKLEKKGAYVGTPPNIASSCNMIFLMLPNGNISKEVIFGEEGLAKYLERGKIVCDMSSVSPGESQYCKMKLQESGVGFLDAPVSGGEPKAIDGTLAFMVGGDRCVYQSVEKYFNIMGSTAILVGESGSGSTAKLANQIIVNLNIAAISEAFVFVKKMGADPQKVYNAIRGGLAGSAVLDAKIPKILARDFMPGGTLAINRKDIGNVLATAHLEDIPVPFSSQLFEIMQCLKVRGLMDADHGGLIQYFEQLAGIEVKVGENENESQ